jgi:TonB family protein
LLPEVKTNVFAGSSEVATLKLPAREVQTGGFGSPNGFGGPVRENGNVVRTGSFGLPPGEGYGNGTGGTKGARGTVASAGFGNGIATGGSGRSPSGSGAVVQTNAFGVVPVAQPKVVRQEAVQSSTKPVEILFKPHPVYTDEARRLGLEGEVALSVVFQANGEVQVLGVLKGLGHGLDQAAVQAAKQIRFKPAQRDGQSVDFPATLRIVFQIAGGCAKEICNGDIHL